MYACYVWKQWEICLQKCKMNKENNIMHVNCNKNDARKGWSIKNLKTENFPVSIGRTSIEYWLREAESLGWKIEFSPSHFDRSNPEELEILKILENFFCRTIWKFVFMIWDVCSWFQMFYKPSFSKKNSNFNNFLQSFLSSLPQNELNKSRSLILEGHKT